MAWVRRWKYWMAEKPTRPGIWKLRDGGYFVRSRVTDLSGRRREVTAVLPDAKTPAEAQRRLDELVADARAEARGEIRTKQTWLAFARSWLEERMRRGEIESAATLERYKDAITLMAPAFGHHDVRDVTRAHVDRWLNGVVADWMHEGKTVTRKRRIDGELVDVEITTRVKATTVNGWLRTLRAISHAAKVKFDLPKSAFDGIDFLPEGRVYTKEQPNALPPDAVHTFMAIAKRRYPQHYAMILLGFVTGLRPSSLRPLRRKGTEADIDWTKGTLEVRRSHSRKQHVMNRTKTKKDTTIALPSEVLDVLKAHVASLEGKAAASDLLFPTDEGKIRTRNILDKPFRAIVAEMGLTMKVTPRAMRRTFQDIMRAAGVHDVVTRSISGHATETMQHHYSTAQANEQRAALARIHAVMAGGDES
jgi:integrase